MEGMPDNTRLQSGAKGVTSVPVDLLPSGLVGWIVPKWFVKAEMLGQSKLTWPVRKKLINRFCVFLSEIPEARLLVSPDGDPAAQLLSSRKTPRHPAGRTGPNSRLIS